MARRAAFVLLSLAVALAAACGGTSRGGVRSGAAGTRLAERALEDRPALVLVPRDGDPSGAVAFATANESGSVASVATAAWLATRLAEQGVHGVVERPHALGFTLSVLAPDPATADRFVTTLNAVLAEAPKAGDAALRAAAAAVEALSRRAAAGPAESAVLSCTGELTPPKVRTAFDAASPAAVAELSSWLARVRSRLTSSVAAVGSAPVLSAVERALARGAAWPEGETWADPWPARDELGVDLSPMATRRLSVATRVASADQAVVAARVAGDPDGMLARRLAMLRPPWTVERALATSRLSGACVRVDLLPPPGDPGPLPADAARVLSVATDEIDRALARPGARALEEAVLEPTDPREAASAAAWSALSGRQKANQPRRLVAYTAPSSERSFDLAGAVAAEHDAARRPSLELRVRSEPGQARVLALVGTPCGTGPESALDAGEAALVVTALARAGGGNGVTFTPVVSADAVALLAEAERLHASESPAAQAERLGRALGEALAVERPSPTDVAAARDELVSRIAAGTRRGYFIALDALSQGHPSWLEPRGTLDALGSAPSGGFEAALARFLARPLRLAVVTNDAGAQGRVVESTVSRLLRPVRGTVTRCPPRTLGALTPRELSVVARGDEGAQTVVGMPFTPFPGRLPKEARAAVLLLNRQGGYLEQSLRDVGASALATALGGPGAAALLVEVQAPAGSERAALERVQALFVRLAQGALSGREVTDALRDVERAEAAERLDPRRRAVELFRGAEPARALDPRELGKFFASLRRESGVLVTVAPRVTP